MEEIAQIMGIESEVYMFTKINASASVPYIPKIYTRQKCTKTSKNHRPWHGHFP